MPVPAAPAFCHNRHAPPAGGVNIPRNSAARGRRAAVCGAPRPSTHRAGHGSHPQLLHHRPYRPRQIHAGGSHHPVVRRTRGARDGGAGAGLEPDRARARHHHQGAVGVVAVHGARRPHLHAQFHRHPRPCRLQLRGQPLAGRLRGRTAGGRRRARRRGAVGGQLLHRGRAGPDRGAGAQQDRPAHRRHRARQGRDRGGDRHRRRGRHRDQRQDRAQRHRGAGGHRRAHPAAAAARYRPPAGADHRLVVRQLHGRGLAGARDAGRDQAARQDSGDVHRTHPRSRVGGCVHAQAQAAGAAGSGRGGLGHGQHQGCARRARWATR